MQQMPWQIWLAANVSFAVAATTCMRQAIRISSKPLLAASFVLNAVSFAAWYVLLPRMPLGIVQACVSGSVIILANVSSAVFFQQVPSLRQTLGILTVIIGVINIQLEPHVAVACNDDDAF